MIHPLAAFMPPLNQMENPMTDEQLEYFYNQDPNGVYKYNSDDEEEQYKRADQRIQEQYEKYQQMLAEETYDDNFSYLEFVEPDPEDDQSIEDNNLEESKISPQKTELIASPEIEMIDMRTTSVTPQTPIMNQHESITDMLDPNPNKKSKKLWSRRRQKNK